MGLQSLNFEAGTAFSAEPATGYNESDSRLLGLNGPVKRAMDIALVMPALIFLLPVFLIIALIIKLEGGPIFFIQQRLGRDGKRFGMIKFRTMHTDAEARLDALLEQCVDSRAEWETFQKLKRDPRITRSGDFLRRSSLDELPQLLNILIGDMSVVGQRPILLNQRDAYGVHIKGYERARPGLTGLWQVSGRNALSFQDRAALGSEYVNQWSLWFDIKLIALTVPRVLLSKDAF
ncbi:sugar transferase [Hyphomonas sp. FCG-A18]|uniref:sugar transferase n=1 Tax=Hyphomonas sp. FCG-A18 TaxID=3080019 RepID=UPI002B2D7D92|nr:sugar transferase [Hyphomonas sp. FCG-A18]